MLPADWRKVGQQFVRNRFSLPAQGLNRPIEVCRIPQRNRRGHHGEAASAMLLRLGGAIA